MIEIKTDGEALDISSGFSIEIEETNPIFNERGSQSIPATVPMTNKNRRLLSHPHRLDCHNGPNDKERIAIISDGSLMRRGLMNITEANRKSGITFNIGLDNSIAYAKMQSVKLKNIPGLPVIDGYAMSYEVKVENLLKDIYDNYQSADPQTTDYAVFPVAVNKENFNGDSGKDAEHWEIINVIKDRESILKRDKVIRIINGEITEVNIPLGYGISPFLRVWRVLELIFNGFNLEIVSNPFKENRELSRLVVLNNMADTICTGKLNYADMMPDCTVEEFMSSLWVRFGLVYHIDSVRQRVTLKFIKDIIKERYDVKLDELLSDYPTIQYNTGEYVVLKAATSLEGAAPATERWEDFSKGTDLKDIRFGSNVAQWMLYDENEYAYWDGDRSPYYMDPEDPDWSDPDFPEPDWPEEDPGREDDWDYERANTRAAKSKQLELDTSIIAREFVTSSWFLLDPWNGEVRQSSSSFFEWNPQSEGLEPYELSSPDECVPMKYIHVSSPEINSSWITGIMPLYLCKARHAHTYIAGGDSTQSEESTPLSFVWAYQIGNKTYGRLSPEDEDGLQVKLDDGTSPTLSLFFQFKDGLFANFWKDFDEIIRHGNRSVEVDTLINKGDIINIKQLSPVALNGVKCLIDSLSYQLPATGNRLPLKFKLRTITTQGDYDIVTEQNIPNFSIGRHKMVWGVYSENFDEKAKDSDLPGKAATIFRDRNNYHSYASGDFFHDIDYRTVKLISYSRDRLIWEEDPDLIQPNKLGDSIVRYYDGWAEFEICEGYFYEDNTERIILHHLDPTPLGTIYVKFEYSVKLMGIFAEC